MASSYLGSLQSGDTVRLAVRSCHDAFRLPSAEEKTPIIMIGSGSGLAPFRGFIQQRAALVGNGTELPAAYLFHGCREPGYDDLYADELSSWQDDGAVKVYHAYSRTPEKANGHKYVQDAIWAESALITELWRHGAKIYLCGSHKMGDAVVEVVQMILASADLVHGDLKQWWESIRNVRYVVEVFD